MHHLLDLGHNVGLHFEPSQADLISVKSLENSLLDAVDVLVKSGVVPEVKAFSFHQTSPSALRFDDREYAGIRNAYAKVYMSPNRYCSDSGGYWRYRPMAEFLKDANVDRAQVLTHPEWWLERDMPPFFKIHRSATSQATHAISKYESLLNSFNLPIHKGIVDYFPKRHSRFESKFGTTLDQLIFQQDYDAAILLLMGQKEDFNSNDLLLALKKYEDSVGLQTYEAVQALFSTTEVTFRSLLESRCQDEEQKLLVILALREQLSSGLPGFM